MRPSTLADYQKLQRNNHNQEAHQLGKKAFSTYLFQLSGCKFLLHKLIEFPLIAAIFDGVRSAVPPAVLLTTLLNDYERHKKSKAYEIAVKRSQNQQGEETLSRKLWWAQHNYAQGEKLSDMVGDGDVNFDDLDESQQLVHDFDTRRLKKTLDEALEQQAFKQQPYRGAGAETWTTY